MLTPLRGYTGRTANSVTASDAGGASQRIPPSSKAHLQRELDVAPIAGCREPAGIRADNSVSIRRVINEVCAVQDVEKLGPELQIPGFTQKRERSVLVHGEVPVQQAGPGQTAPRHIPQVTRNGRGEHVWIEPPVGVTGNDCGRIVNDSIDITQPAQWGKTGGADAGGHIAQIDGCDQFGALIG